MAKEQGNGFVTWTKLFGVLGLLLTVAAGAFGFTLNVQSKVIDEKISAQSEKLILHTEQPHVGSARLRDIQRIERSIERLEGKIDDLRNRHRNDQ